MQKQLFILSFALLSLSSAMATNLVVKPLSGADYRRELATIGKLVYHSDSLYLYDSFGTLLYREQLAKVQQLTYSEGGDPTTSLPATQSEATTLRVYPNPTTSVLIMEVRSEVYSDDVGSRTQDVPCAYANSPAPLAGRGQGGGASKEVWSSGSTQEQSDQTARLYNQQGQLLKTTTLTTARTTMDVSDLPAGSYLLLCNGEAFKVIVQ